MYHFRNYSCDIIFTRTRLLTDAKHNLLTNSTRRRTKQKPQPHDSRTTYENPDGGIGTFSPQFMNITLSYAKKFTYSMSAGVTIKMISESAAELSANGIALDAGVHYQTGENGEAKFGITLKNIGPRMSFEGDGDDLTLTGPNGSDMTVEIRSAAFELPSLLNIGASYDFLFSNQRHSVKKSF